MKNFDNNQFTPELNERSLEKKEAIQKFFDYHLQNVNSFRQSNDSDSAFTAYNLMILHLKKWDITDAEINTNLSSLSKEQGLFHLNLARRLKGRLGALLELKKLDFCLETGALSLTDLDSSLEEIEKIRASIEI